MKKADAFVEALDALRSGVYVVTASFRREMAGCTCVWVSRVSFDPPLICTSLAPERHTLGVIEQGKRFCVNILGASAAELARRFGFKSHKDGDKFEGVEFEKGKSGSPVLGGAASYIDCRLHSIVPAGDHRMVIGRIVDAGTLSGEQPLIYDPASFYEGQMRREASHGEQ